MLVQVRESNLSRNKDLEVRNHDFPLISSTPRIVQYWCEFRNVNYHGGLRLLRRLPRSSLGSQRNRQITCLKRLYLKTICLAEYNSRFVTLNLPVSRIATHFPHDMCNFIDSGGHDFLLNYLCLLKIQLQFKHLFLRELAEVTHSLLLHSIGFVV